MGIELAAPLEWLAPTRNIWALESLDVDWYICESTLVNLFHMASEACFVIQHLTAAEKSASLWVFDISLGDCSVLSVLFEDS